MRVAVIGVGRMGRNHIKVVQTLGLELAGISDQNEISLAGSGGECGVPAELRFTDASKLLERSNPDVVIIATTAPSHCEYTCMAAEAGAKFILCEKPMAVSLSQCDRMIETCERHGAKLAINHPSRFEERFTKAKDIVCSEEFGGLTSAVLIAGNMGWANNGSHHFEMFRLLTGETPVEVSAWFSEELVPNPRGPQYEDRGGSIRAITSSGKRLYIEEGTDQGHGVKIIYSGRYGQLTVDYLQGRMDLSVRDAEFRDLPTTRYASPSINKTINFEPLEIRSAIASVVEAMLNGGNAPSGQDGRSAIASLVAVYMSAENGNMPVKLNGQLLRDRVFPWA